MDSLWNLPIHKFFPPPEISSNLPKKNKKSAFARSKGAFCSASSRHDEMIQAAELQMWFWILKLVVPLGEFPQRQNCLIPLNTLFVTTTWLCGQVSCSTPVNKTIMFRNRQYGQLSWSMRSLHVNTCTGNCSCWYECVFK